MVGKTVCLYHYGGQSGLANALLSTEKNKNKFIYVDSYPCKDETIEKELILNSVPGSRVIWAGLENGEYIYGQNIKQVMPYANDEINDDLVNKKLERITIEPLMISNAIRMAQRTHLCNLSYSEIIFIIERICSFWNAYISIFKIDVVLSTLVPHSFGDYLFACVCKCRKIKFIAQVPHGLYENSFILEMTNEIYLKTKNDSKSLVYINAKKEFEDFLIALTGKNQSTPYSTGVKELRNEYFTKTKKFLLSGTENSTQILKYRGDLARYYDHISNNIDISKLSAKTHLYFLHYQPEATTNPLAKNFSEQRNAIDYILKELKSDEVLIVKEHPHQFFQAGLHDEGDPLHLEKVLNFRTFEYYKYLSNQPKVVIASRKLKAIELMINKSKVWVNTGTVALQAALLGSELKFLDALCPYIFLRDLNLDSLTKEEIINIISEEGAKYLENCVRIDFDFITDKEGTVNQINKILDLIGLS